jgi:hypothetical protein
LTRNASLNNSKSEGSAELERLKTDQRKVELEVSIIRHFRVGYILILFTPVLSFAVLGLLVGIIESLGGEGETLTAWNVSILVLSIIGIAQSMGHETRGDRSRSKSDFAVQLLSHSVGSVYLPFCFRAVHCSNLSEHEPRDERTHGMGLHEILDVEAKRNLMDRHRAPVDSNFTRKAARLCPRRLARARLIKLFSRHLPKS